jgi:hypothetical protein
MNLKVSARCSVTYLLKVHALHCPIHASYNIGHTSCNLSHGDGCLHSTTDCINPTSQPEQVQLLILLAYCVLGVNFGDICVILLDSLLIGQER